MPRPPAPSARARRAHLCACPDPTRHVELRSTLGTSYVAIRRPVLRSVLSLLKKAAATNQSFESDNVALARENASLRAALKKTLDLSVESPVFKGGLGGRTAIEAYRGNAGRFVQLMNEVGVRAQVLGEENAEFFLMGPVKLDLETLWAAPASTEEEGLRRDDLRHKLTVSHERRLLIRPDGVGERCRQQFISDVASSGIDTSVQELVRRSGEFVHGSVGRVSDDD
jgi:hypothetical protein